VAIPSVSISILGGSSPSASVSNGSVIVSSTSSSSSSTLSSTSSIPTTSSSVVIVLQTTTSGNQVITATITSTPTADQSAAASATNTDLSDDTSDSSGGHLTRNTIIAIVVVASCVGGAIVIWTVIRKWKFAPSDEFGERLNPIDWRPNTSAEKGQGSGGGDLEGTNVGHRRNGSRGSNRSFVSADASANNSIRGGGGMGNMIPDLPTHDFTAGAANTSGLAPYGDVRRGPSPTPSMGMGGEQYYRGYGATAMQYGQRG
jgi:hypothetical protein